MGPKSASASLASFWYARFNVSTRSDRQLADHGRKPEMTVSRPHVEAKPASAGGQAAAMIEIDHVSQVFRTSGRQDHLALSDISLTIEDGAFVSILGPSGCGKSTLLYVVGGFVNPTGGVAKVKGKPITGPGPDRGPVFQEFALFPWKSVLGNVMYGPGP